MVAVMILAGLSGQHLKELNSITQQPSGSVSRKLIHLLGITIHPDNIRAVLSDPEDIVRTEVLCQWVDTINPVINPSQWESCKVEGLATQP
jgi:hypothetical protein